MKCVKCGNNLDAGALFCGQCGAVVGVKYGKAGHGAEFPTGSPPVVPLALGAPAVKSIVERAKAIVLRPRTEWPVIANEPTTPMEIYSGYAAPLVAIGAIALFVGQVVFGTPVPLLGIVRAGIMTGLAAAIVMFVLSMINLGVLAVIVNGLAPKFGGQRDALRALKVTAYSYTPAWLAGAFNLAPALSILALLASLYGVYLLLIGLPELMRCPKQQAVGYALSVVACAVVLYLILGALTTLVAGFGPGMYA